VIINQKSGRSKGYGFVEMETEEMAIEAVKKFEGATLNERPITVQLATPKQESEAKPATEPEAKLVTEPEAKLVTEPEAPAAE
jgi:RNA recognition motif-containing protein